MNKMIIAPSTHPAKSFNDLLGYVKKMQNCGADAIHCDIMDGKFVSDKTFQCREVKILKSLTTLPLDVHLMVLNPEKHYKDYVNAGANIITVHYESFLKKSEIVKVLENIRKIKCLAGLSIKPETMVSEISDLLPLCDLILVMSVEPGKSGQKFDQFALQKILQLKKIKTNASLKLIIEVDGGVNEKNISFIKESGADMIVSGNYLYNSDNLTDSINSLKI